MFWKKHLDGSAIRPDLIIHLCFGGLTFNFVCNVDK